MKRGNTLIMNVKRGTTQIQKIYRGAFLVWQYIITGIICSLSGSSLNIQFGVNLLGTETTPIKPTKLYIDLSGRFIDEAFGGGNVYVYGLKADNTRVLLYTVYANSRDWGVNGIVAVAGTEFFKNINIYATSGPKTSLNATCYFTEWYAA